MPIAPFLHALAEGIDLDVVFLVVGLLVVFVLLVIFLKFFKLWIQAYFSGAQISLFELIGMWLRKVNASVIVHAKIAMVQAGLPIETRDLEAHYLAGGNVTTVVRALIAADRARHRPRLPARPRRSTSPGATCSRRSRPASTRRSSTAPTRGRARPRSPPWPRTASRCWRARA